MAIPYTGPIVTRLIFTAAEIKDWLGLDVDPSLVTGTIAMLVKAAKQMADEYCNNPFKEGDGTEVPIPDAVKTGVLQVLTDLYQSWVEAKGGGTSTGIVVARKTGDMSVTYAKPGETISYISDLSQLAKNLLNVYRLTPF